MAKVEHVSNPDEVLKIPNFESLKIGDIYLDLDIGELKIKTQPNPFQDEEPRYNFVQFRNGLHSIQALHRSLGVYPYKLTVKFWKSVDNIEVGKIYRHKIDNSVFMKTDEPYFVRLDTGQIMPAKVFTKDFYQEAIDPRFFPID